MYLTEKAQQIIKWVSYGIQVLLIALVITFGAMTANRGKVIKQQEQKVEALTCQVDSLNRVNRALGAESCYTVNCTINLTSKNVLGVNTINSNNIARTVATVTRQELLNYTDSVHLAAGCSLPALKNSKTEQ